MPRDAGDAPLGQPLRSDAHRLRRARLVDAQPLLARVRVRARVSVRVTEGRAVPGGRVVRVRVRVRVRDRVRVRVRVRVKYLSLSTRLPFCYC